MPKPMRRAKVLFIDADLFFFMRPGERTVITENDIPMDAACAGIYQTERNEIAVVVEHANFELVADDVATMPRLNGPTPQMLLSSSPQPNFN